MEEEVGTEAFEPEVIALLAIPEVEMISDRSASFPFVSVAVDGREDDEVVVVVAVAEEDDDDEAAAAAMADAWAIRFSRRFCRSSVVDVVVELVVVVLKTAPLTIRETEWLSEVFVGNKVVARLLVLDVQIEEPEDVVDDKECVLITSDDADVSGP